MRVRIELILETVFKPCIFQRYAMSNMLFLKGISLFFFLKKAKNTVMISENLYYSLIFQKTTSIFMFLLFISVLMLRPKNKKQKIVFYTRKYMSCSFSSIKNYFFFKKKTTTGLNVIFIKKKIEIKKKN